MAVLKYLGKDKKYHALPIGESIDIVQYDEYSTDETIVGKWINGKPIYRKVIPFTFPSSSGLTAFENVLPEDMEFLVSIRGKSSDINQNDSNMDVFRDFPFQLSSNDYVSIYVNYRTITLYAGSNVVSWNATNSSVFIVEYTKSTDAENSFTTDMISAANSLDDTVTEQEVDSCLTV